jgi:Carboxypeptidase regulatory-like domain
MRRFRTALLGAMLFLFSATASQAQTTGSINGSVADNTGGMLPGVTVTATSPALMGVQTAVSNEQGTYRFPAVPPARTR